ncbi:MAG TPA: hypothetical protein VKW70_09910 [Terriglobia bacterium]|nr:hypothetical protein [Terriglobia bacterium]
MKKRGFEKTTAQERLIALRSTRDPTDPCWELHIRPGEGYWVLLIGWVMSEALIDAGVPSGVAEILTRALCRGNRLVFLHPSASAQPDSSSGWQPIEGGWAYDLRPGTGGRLRGAPPLPLISTEEAMTARRMFHAEPFSWEMRSQIALLFLPGSTLPQLDYPFIFQLWKKAAFHRETLLNPGVQGIIFPGVDGDFAECIFLQKASREDFERRLENECRKAGILWESVSEDEFKSTRWFQQ